MARQLYKLEVGISGLARLKALPAEPPPKEEFSRQDILKMWVGEIENRLERNFSMEQIASTLSADGFEISGSSLRSYLNQFRKESGDKSPKLDGDAVRDKKNIARIARGAKARAKARTKVAQTKAATLTASSARSATTIDLADSEKQKDAEASSANGNPSVEAGPAMEDTSSIATTDIKQSVRPEEPPLPRGQFRINRDIPRL